MNEIRVTSFEDWIPRWPSYRWGAFEFVPPARLDGPVHRQSTMKPGDFSRFTPEGRDTLARILRRTLERNGRCPRG